MNCAITGNILELLHNTRGPVYFDRSAVASRPRPKCTGPALEDAYPTLVET